MTPKPLLVLALLLSLPLFAQTADLAVSAQFQVDGKVAIGEGVRLRVPIVNAGPDVARNVRATVALPPGMTVAHPFVTPSFVGTCTTDEPRQTATCSFGDLSTVERVMFVDVRTPAALGTFSATASVLSDTPDHNPGNNTAAAPVETENRTDVWVYTMPQRSRADPGQAVTLEARLTNTLATLPGTRFFLDIAVADGTIESIDAPSWQCTIDGPTARCVIAATTSVCCIDDPLQITVRTTTDRDVAATRVAIEGSSDVPGGAYSPEPATIELTRLIAVTSTGDAGPGTLRAAFEEANAVCAERLCRIDFALPPPVPAEGWFTIVPETPLPVLRVSSVIVDATAQTALTGDTNPLGPEVAIDGRKAGEGLEIHAPCEAAVRGLVLGNFLANQALWMTTDHRSCEHFRPQQARAYDITGNHIGVGPTGAEPWPNLRGLILDDAGNVLVTKNVISRNRFSGVWMWRGAASFLANRIEHNGASGIFFGPEVGWGEVLANTIVGHRDMGVAVARGAWQIDIRQNSMRDNGGLGIDWGLDGPSPLVEDDTGLGAPNPPVVLSAVYDPAADQTLVTMTLNSRPAAQRFNGWVIDVYTNDTPDGDGERFVAEQQLQTVPQGPFVVKVRGNHEGKWLNATTSRVYFIYFAKPGEPRTESFGGGETMTSELSNAVQVTR